MLAESLSCIWLHYIYPAFLCTLINILAATKLWTKVDHAESLIFSLKVSYSFALWQLSILHHTQPFLDHIKCAFLQHILILSPRSLDFPQKFKFST